MERIIMTGLVPIESWAVEIEESAVEQAKRVANLPFIDRKVVLMADAHAGFGCPVGTVVASKGVIIPSIIGNDIGCGIAALPTTMKKIDTKSLRSVVDMIQEAIPVGFKIREEPAPLSGLPLVPPPAVFGSMILEDQLHLARHQLGTLGGGNHFIEISKGSDGFIWVMVHTGSRGVGAKVAEHYSKRAKFLNAKFHSSVDPKHDLAFLPMSTADGQTYFKEMNWCIEYARRNRMHILAEIRVALGKIMPTIGFGDTLDTVHNYASIEHHYGRNYFLHRKGAVNATVGNCVVVAGSMGTPSYICIGKGNQAAFRSCSHGAGRVLSRTKAKSDLNYKDQKGILDRQGIIHDMNSVDKLDEAPGAYKDIRKVMEAQKDLVSVDVQLQPLAVIKG